MNTAQSALSSGLTRRQAVRMSIATAIASWLVPWQFAKGQAMPSVSPDARASVSPIVEPSGPYTLPPLPYAYEALEPNIDTLTMHLHHDRHHLAYVNNANKLLIGQPDLAKLTPEELLQNLDKAPEDIRTGLRNNVGGHVNHSLFWQMMSPTGGGEPSGTVADAINAQFGSFQAFKTQLNEAALKRFGSGWAWLIKGKDGKLSIISTANQDSPVMDGNIPLLGLDVWEHAYYLKYQNMRANYAYAWWNTVNWDFVGKQFAKSSV